MATDEPPAMQGEVVNEQALVVRGDDLTARHAALAIVDDRSFQLGADLSRELAVWIKAAEAYFATMREPAYRAWRAICDREKEAIGPKKTLKAALGDTLAGYEQALVVCRRLAEEAAQREREQLEGAERVRVAAEQARLRAEEEDRRLAQAAAAEAIGDHDTAARLLEEPIEVAPVVPRPVFQPPVTVAPAPKAEGISWSDHRTAAMKSMPDLLRAAAAGNAVAVACLAFDQVRANKIAVGLQLKDGELIAPGVVMVVKRTTVTRT